MSEAFLCDAARTPFGRYGGTLSGVRADELAAAPITALIARNPSLGAEAVDDMILGCANQAGEDNRNVARMAALLAGLPVPHTLVEIWQANAAGRYRHAVDEHHAPLDPNFTGCGRTLTDAEGRYRFITIKPGAYPWRNHPNAWRPAHIHFSLFGPSFCTRLVTQMYFPGDPLLARDPMYLSVPGEEARLRLIAAFDWETTVPEVALGYRFDIVLRGREATPMEGPPGGRS